MYPIATDLPAHHTHLVSGSVASSRPILTFGFFFVLQLPWSAGPPAEAPVTTSFMQKGLESLCSLCFLSWFHRHISVNHTRTHRSALCGLLAQSPSAARPYLIPYAHTPGQNANSKTISSPPRFANSTPRNSRLSSLSRLLLPQAYSTCIPQLP